MSLETFAVAVTPNVCRKKLFSFFWRMIYSGTFLSILQKFERSLNLVLWSRSRTYVEILTDQVSRNSHPGRNVCSENTAEIMIDYLLFIKIRNTYDCLYHFIIFIVFIIFRSYLLLRHRHHQRCSDRPYQTAHPCLS